MGDVSSSKAANRWTRTSRSSWFSIISSAKRSSEISRKRLFKPNSSPLCCFEPYIQYNHSRTSFCNLVSSLRLRVQVQNYWLSLQQRLRILSSNTSPRQNHWCWKNISWQEKNYLKFHGITAYKLHNWFPIPKEKRTQKVRWSNHTCTPSK